LRGGVSHLRGGAIWRRRLPLPPNAYLGVLSSLSYKIMLISLNPLVWKPGERASTIVSIIFILNKREGFGGLP